MSGEGGGRGRNSRASRQRDKDNARGGGNAAAPSPRVSGREATRACARCSPLGRRVDLMADDKRVRKPEAVATATTTKTTIGPFVPPDRRSRHGYLIRFGERRAAAAAGTWRQR